MLRIERDASRHVTTFVFDGRMDAARSSAVTEEVEQELAARATSGSQDTIVFDMAAVPYVASGFLRLCLIAAKRLPPRQLWLARVQPEVRKVFMIAGLDRLFSFE